MTGIKESDTGLAPPAFWDLTADKQTLQNEQPLQVNNSFIKIYEQFKNLTINFIRLPDVQKLSMLIQMILNI